MSTMMKVARGAGLGAVVAGVAEVLVAQGAYPAGSQPFADGGPLMLVLAALGVAGGAALGVMQTRGDGESRWVVSAGSMALLGQVATGLGLTVAEGALQAAPERAAELGAAALPVASIPGVFGGAMAVVPLLVGVWVGASRDRVVERPVAGWLVAGLALAAVQALVLPAVGALGLAAVWTLACLGIRLTRPGAPSVMLGCIAPVVAAVAALRHARYHAWLDLPEVPAGLGLIEVALIAAWVAISIALWAARGARVGRGLTAAVVGTGVVVAAAAAWTLMVETRMLDVVGG